MVQGLYHKKRHWVTLGFYSLAVIVMISMPGKWYPHYYQFWLPIFAIGTGWFVNQISINRKKLALLTIFLVGIIQYRFIFWTPESISTVKYGPIFTYTKESSQLINSILNEEETFYQYGSDVVFNYYTKKLTVTPVTFISFLDYLDSNDYLINKHMNALSKSKPELVIIRVPNNYSVNLEEDKKKNRNYDKVINWIEEHYRPSIRYGDHFWFRKGGRLDNTYL
jgi:hypothetical protein